MVDSCPNSASKLWLRGWLKRLFQVLCSAMKTVPVILISQAKICKMVIYVYTFFCSIPFEGLLST